MMRMMMTDTWESARSQTPSPASQPHRIEASSPLPSPWVWPDPSLDSKKAIASRPLFQWRALTMSAANWSLRRSLADRFLLRCQIQLDWARTQSDDNSLGELTTAWLGSVCHHHRIVSFSPGVRGRRRRSSICGRHRRHKMVDVCT